MTATATAATAPVRVARVGLRARDAEALAAWYRETVGLAELGRTGGVIHLGVGGTGLLDIEPAPEARPDDPQAAGLFHTAFLLPARRDLGRWLRHAAARGIGLDGASDHLVSEALYLDDPEGNGVEIYADRAPEAWPRRDGAIAMATLPLDLEALMREAADAPDWNGAPDGTIIGHVHLRVGDPARAARWWADALGFETMARYGEKAVFLATGGYHHHVGANAWRSAGAGRREAGRAGLAWVELAARGRQAGATLEDPWGTEVRVVPAAA